MRKLPLILLCSVSMIAIAHGEEITSETNDPVLSSTISDGSSGDVEITSAGSIETEETDGFIAVTMDSDNDFLNEGEILIEDSDNAVGVLLRPGYSGSITNDGSIEVSETYEREDEDDDDDDDGPYAIGENRYGILLESGGTYTGDITTLSGSSIEVEGNNSVAVSLQSILDGSFVHDGSMYTVGDNAIGIDAQSEITGDLLVSGTVNVKGENSTAISVESDVGGALTIEGYIQSTGFGSTSTTNYIAPSYVDEDTEAVEDRVDAEVLLDNAGSVMIGGSLTNGFLINGAVDDYTSEEDEDDETKDTVDDFDENRATGSVYSFGSGAAVLISADYGDEQAGDLVIGQVVETVRDTTDDDDDDDIDEALAVFTYDEGFINRGTISSSGVNIGFDALGLRVEGEQNGDAQTIITGGILNDGTITARAYEANATAVSIREGAVIGTINNDGSIIARSSTTDGHSAIAVLIEDGADVSEFINTGTITANSIGRSGNVVGVLDESSGITSFTNMGIIAASHTTDGQTVDEWGDIIALDFSDHDASSGVTFVQDYETPTEDTNEDDEIDTDDVTSPYMVGDVLFGAGNDSFSVLAGYVTGDLDFGTGDGELILDDAQLYGDATFSAGNAEVSLSDAE